MVYVGLLVAALCMVTQNCMWLQSHSSRNLFKKTEVNRYCERRTVEPLVAQQRDLKQMQRLIALYQVGRESFLGSVCGYVTSECRENCPVGKFSDSLSHCAPCSSNCKTCAGESQTCLSCEAEFSILFESVCRSDCPNGFFIDRDSCSPCAPSCATCDETACFSCDEGWVLSDGACLQQCPLPSQDENGVCVSISPTPSRMLLLPPIMPSPGPIFLPPTPTMLLRSLSTSSSPFPSSSMERTEETIPLPDGGRLTIPLNLAETPSDLSYNFTVRPELERVPGSGLLASGTVDIQLVDQTGRPVHQLRESLEICLKPVAGSEGAPCLSFLDEESDKWICEDKCLKKEKSGALCGTTGHLTSFALLLQIDGGDKEDCGDEAALTPIVILSIAFLGAAGLLVVLSTILIELRYHWKRRARSQALHLANQIS